jgi:acyl-CoA thioesterase-2
VQVASLDHAMWFHRDFRCGDWFLHAMDCPSTCNTRGFARGQIFTRDGTLVASVAQEGMIRLRSGLTPDE